ncbi:unnamed protein product [Mytilus coruscus]|uniref:TLDc domain-containing protein n=1 Tax=Mytilus coruscus TaxID=42192 RepID=A0A6J8AUN4_MYTCO|nr:unnamed protein product [Mytilus coruscus]
MSKQLSEQEKDKISKWIKGGKKKNYTQLYSAASSGFNSSRFHGNCDNKGPTVTLVYNRNGSVYGGYASVSWMSGSGESVYDGDAFLFLLTGGFKNNSCKFTIKIPEFALTMNKDYGPSFGKGPDLLTFEDKDTEDCTDDFTEDDTDDDTEDTATHTDDDTEDTATHTDDDTEDTATHTDDDTEDTATHTDDDTEDTATHTDDDTEDTATHTDDNTEDTATHSFNHNSVMIPHSYNISEQTVEDIIGGEFGAVDVVVYAVEDVAEDMFLTTPWREMDLPTWDSKLQELLKRDIEEYWPLREMGVAENTIPYVNVLLLGPVGSGKSSFFNTLNSIFRGRLSIQARAGSSDSSLTKSFNVYSIILNQRPLRFRICDCRGFEDAHEIDQYDIEAILDGNIKDNYTFADKSRIRKESPFYRQDPKMHDRIHSVAIVVDGNNDPDYPMTDRVQEQMKKTQELMNQKGVPQLILMNKIDCLSETIRHNLSCIFHSPDIKDRVEKLAHSLRLPSYTVLPMKNINSEQRINENVNILALYNLRQMLRAADDYLLNYLDEFLGDKL